MRPARRDGSASGARAARARRPSSTSTATAISTSSPTSSARSPMVLVSNLTEKTRVRYVAVKLTGTTSNRNGLGAVVKVTAGGSTYTKVMDGNSGYLSHSLYAAVLRARRCRGGRQHRSPVAVGEEADRSAAVQDQFAASRCASSRRQALATALRRRRTGPRRQGRSRAATPDAAPGTPPAPPWPCRPPSGPRP